jgi:formiminotetrahydrofolate cyclodeaminase
MKEKTVKQWTQALASKDGKYGGGSAASLIGAMAANLAQYVYEIQEGKKEYEAHDREIKTAIKKCETLSEELLVLAEEDADAFEPVLDLFKLPKDTEEEKAYRRKKLDQGFADAAKPPFEIMEKMDEVMDLFDHLISLEVRGSIVDDIAVGLIFTQATIESEKLNCDINIKYIKDEEMKQELAQKTDETYHTMMERNRQLKETAFKIIANN